MTKPNLQVAYFEAWQHQAAEPHLEQYSEIEAVRLRYADPTEDNLRALAAADVYQVLSNRDELPTQYFVTRELLAHCPDMLVVSTHGSGYDTVDLDACTAAGVIAVNQAGGNKQAVAEHALGMMLSLASRLHEADKVVRRGGFTTREDLLGRDIHGKTVGIVGLGHVGGQVARLCGTLFEMRVLAYDPYLSEAQFRERGVEPVDLHDLMRQSDFVTIHCPRTAETTGMIGRTEIELMRAGTYFISTARGGIHDEAALVDALAGSKLAGAGLDVWDTEPPPPDHPLLQFETVIATPHTAGVTHESRRTVALGTIDQLAAIYSGKRPSRLLNPAVWPAYAERFESLMGKPVET